MLRNELPSSAKFDAFYAKMRPIYLNLKYRLWNEISDELELLLLRSAVLLNSETTRLPKLKAVQCRPSELGNYSLAEAQSHLSEFGNYPVLSWARVELRRMAGT